MICGAKQFGGLLPLPLHGKSAFKQSLVVQRAVACIAMSRFATVLLRLAVFFLPVSEQARFLDEWRVEAEVARQQSGEFAAVVFAVRLLLAAPRMTLVMRSGSESAFAELSIGLIFSVFPSVVLAGLAIFTEVWIMLIAELSIIVGVLMMASGFWSFEGRLLDSRRARIGVVFAVVGSGIEVAVRRLTGFGPPIDDVVSATIPHTVIMIGLILWVVSSYAGRYSYRVLWLAVGLLAPGAALNVLVTVINGWSLSGFDRFGVLMYVVPSAGLAWACFSLLGRRQVFDAGALLEI